MKTPSSAEIEEFAAQNAKYLWATIGDEWRCPACKRNRIELLRPLRGRYPVVWGCSFIAEHHDHAADYGLPERFAATVICGECNWADGRVKHRLGIPNHFSFAPHEIATFIIAAPHQMHGTDIEAAATAYLRAVGAPLESAIFTSDAEPGNTPVRFTMTLDGELNDQMEDARKQYRMTRLAWIRQAIIEKLER